MNDFTGLQDWSKGLNSPSVKTKEQLLDKYMQYPSLRRAWAKKEESYCVAYIVGIYHDCAEHGELVKESDGQFTGGYSTETFRFAGDVYEFGFYKDRLRDMVVFDGRLY